MSTTISNPLSFQHTIFKHNFQDLMSTKFENFSAGYFRHLIFHIFNGEYDATIAYPMIRSRFQSGFYASELSKLSPCDRQKLVDYFDVMIVDENNHTEYLETLIHNLYQYAPSNSDKQEITNKVNTWLSTESLSETLSRYYIGECYLWTLFYKIYKTTVNQDLKKIIHQLLVDESRHNNSIYKILKMLSNNINLDTDQYNKTVRDIRYLGLPYVCESFDLADTNTKKDLWWLTLTYDTEWHKKFNYIFLKKCFQVIQIFHPTAKFQDYQKLINQIF